MAVVMPCIPVFAAIRKTKAGQRVRRVARPGARDKARGDVLRLVAVGVRTPAVDYAVGQGNRIANDVACEIAEHLHTRVPVRRHSGCETAFHEQQVGCGNQALVAERRLEPPETNPERFGKLSVEICVADIDGVSPRSRR